MTRTRGARLFELATKRTAASVRLFSPEMLDRFPRLRRDEFPIDDVQFEELRFRVQVWRVGALELSSPEERPTELGNDRDTGIDLGY